MIKSIINIPVSIIQTISNQLVKLSQSFSKKINKPVEASFLHYKGAIKAIGIGLLVGTFLFIFQPNEIAEFSGQNKTLWILATAAMAALGVLLSEFALPSVFKNYFDRKKWNVINEITLLMLNVFFAGLLSMIFANQIGLARFDLPMQLLKITGVAFIAAIIFAFIKETFLHKKYSSKADELNQHLQALPVVGKSEQLFPVLVFAGSNDKISVVPNQLINVVMNKYEAEFNYQNFFGTVTKKLSINAEDVKKELEKHSQFIQLDKTHFVNVNALTKVKANAAGYQVKISKVEDEHPTQHQFLRSILNF